MTRPERPRSAVASLAPASRTPIGLLLGVAMACLLVGVIVTVLAMKLVAH